MVVQVASEHAVQVSEAIRKVGTGGFHQDLCTIDGASCQYDRAAVDAVFATGAWVSADHCDHASLGWRPHQTKRWRVVANGEPSALFDGLINRVKALNAVAERVTVVSAP